MIYFDSAASYPLLSEIRNNLPLYFENSANPSSGHKMGVDAHDSVDATRTLIADSISAMDSEIIFTSGATESNNLAIKSHFMQPTMAKKRHMIVAAIEHKCVLAIVNYLQAHENVSVSVVMPNEHGVITVEAISALVQDDTSLVSVMHINNELGTANPIAEIGQFCFSNGINLHVDCAQSYLKTEIDVDAMNIDYLSISAHKIGGMKGVGAVYVRNRRQKQIEAVIHGAGQEHGVRGGTLPSPLIHAFGTAIETFPAKSKLLKNQNFGGFLLHILDDLFVPYQINGVPNHLILSLTLPNTDIGVMIRSSYNELSLAAGSACSSGELEPSHVLTAIGLDRETADLTLRISFHHELRGDDVIKLAHTISQFTEKKQ